MGSTDFYDCYEKNHENGPVDINTVICKYLLSYRNNPQTSTSLSPTELLYKRN